MRNRSSKSQKGRVGADPAPDQAADGPVGKDPNSPDAGHLSMDGIQVVNRHCTICEWEAQLVERGLGDDPLCPWCYGPTERTSVVGLVVPESLRPGQKNPYAASLGRLGGLKGGPARAAKLSAKQRREIATKAAKARWAGKKAKPAPGPKHVAEPKQSASSKHPADTRHAKDSKRTTDAKGARNGKRKGS